MSDKSLFERSVLEDEVDYRTLVLGLQELSLEDQAPIVAEVLEVVNAKLQWAQREHEHDSRALYWARQPWVGCHMGPGTIKACWPQFPDGPPPPMLRLARWFSPPDAEPAHLEAILRACPHLGKLELFDPLSERALEVLVTLGPDTLHSVVVDQEQERTSEQEVALPHTLLGALLQRFALRELVVIGGLDDRALEHLAGVATEPLAMEVLMLHGHRFTSTGIAALAKCPWAALKTLSLNPHPDHRYRLRGVEALAASPHLGTLRTLTDRLLHARGGGQGHRSGVDDALRRPRDRLLARSTRGAGPLFADVDGGGTMRHITRTLSALFVAALATTGCTGTHSGSCGTTRCASGESCCCGVCLAPGAVCECAADAGMDDASLPLDGGPQRCVANEDCGAADYCVAANGCGTAGTCRPRPMTCSSDDPVCGCDGRTYANACGAGALGVDIARAGACEAPPLACGTRGGVQCAAPEFCFRDRDPHCGASDGGGVCVTPPTSCTEEFAPVCSCSGVTYGNECEARADSASVRHDGSCEEPPVCEAQDIQIVDPSCDEQTIYWDGFRCVEATGCCEGDCGAGYLSIGACLEAHRSCDRYCGGEAGATCLSDEFCDFSGPGCDWSDATGTCTPRPSGCPEPGGVPVCGCDGQTYFNECSAHLAGTDSSGSGGGCPVPG